MEEIKINKKIRLIELFAGYGSQAMALRNIGAEFEKYKVVEFEKNVLNSYNAIHGTDFPVIDIKNITGKDLEINEKEKFTYLLTYSFPCTDLSLSGKVAGMEKGSGTRSALLWEVERLLKQTEELPDILVMENVPQVISKRNKSSFDEWCHFLESKGYKNHISILNARDFGIPQNRRRCFMVSTLGNYEYRFPSGIPLTISAKEYLEESVEEKYFMSEEKVNKLIENLFQKNLNQEVVNSILDRSNGTCIGAIRGRYISGENGKTEQRLELNTECLCNTLTTVQKDNMVLIRQATKKGYIECESAGVADLPYPSSTTRRGRVIDNGNVCPTIMTSNNELCAVYSIYRIRRLTPKECGRFMSVSDEDIEIMRKINSETQLYKQYGNSIVVKCLEAVFRNLNIKGVKNWKELSEEGE